MVGDGVGLVSLVEMVGDGVGLGVHKPPGAILPESDCVTARAVRTSSEPLLEGAGPKELVRADTSPTIEEGEVVQRTAADVCAERLGGEVGLTVVPEV